MGMLPVMARVYGLSPADVYALTGDEFEAFATDLEAMQGGRSQ